MTGEGAAAAHSGRAARLHEAMRLDGVFVAAVPLTVLSRTFSSSTRHMLPRVVVLVFRARESDCIISIWRSSSAARTYEFRPTG